MYRDQPRRIGCHSAKDLKQFLCVIFVLMINIVTQVSNHFPFIQTIENVQFLH